MRFKPTKLITRYTCGDCGKEYDLPVNAEECCGADCIYCPLSDLPVDAEIGHDTAFSYGTVFSDSWEIVRNTTWTPVLKPVHVYPLPPLVSKLVMSIFTERFERGEESARSKMRDALGVDQIG